MYANPGNSVGIFDLKVDVDNDLRTNDPPWDILSMDGCRGTSALPATNGICFVPSQGDVTVSFNLQYRPVLAATFGGNVGLPLATLIVNGGPGPNYQGSGSGFACDALNNPTSMTCARHLAKDQPVTVGAGSTQQATLVSSSPPCTGQTCAFNLDADTCLAFIYQNSVPGLQEAQLSGPDCPSGPGLGGSGGGGGPPQLSPLKHLALDQIRHDFEQRLAPCLTAVSGLTIFTAPVGLALGPIVGVTMLRAASPLCVSIVRRLILLQKIYNDPPDPAFRTVAPITPSAKPVLHLPSCDSVTGADRRACHRLEKTVALYVRKDQDVSDVAASLQTTVDRASAAAKAGNQKALKRQLHAAEKRKKQLDAARAREIRIGTKLASALQEASATATLSEAQFTDATTIVLGKLAEQGLSNADARTVLGPALTPQAIDLLMLLGQ